MDGEELLNRLEGLRHDIPGFLQNDYEDLIQKIRQIYEFSIRYIAPSWPVDGGRQQLLTHHTTLDDLHTQLNTSLVSFQSAYQGPGSEAYHHTAALTLQHLGALRDHVNFATQQHQTIASNLDTSHESQLILIGLIGALAVTLGVLIFSGGTTAPVTVPAAAGEAAGGAATVATLVEASTATETALMSLGEAGMEAEGTIAGMETSEVGIEEGAVDLSGDGNLAADEDMPSEPGEPSGGGPRGPDDPGDGGGEGGGDAGGDSEFQDNVNRAIERERPPEREAHIFENRLHDHNWDVTGLDREGNWNLIRTTLENNQGIIENAPDRTPIDVVTNFGRYSVTVRIFLINGVIRIGTAWVNAI
jgi:hypothetical protein